MDVRQQKQGPKRERQSEEQLGNYGKRRNEDQQKEEGSSEVASEDLLSRLPHLCLIEIGKLLTRTDVFNLSMANKKMRPLENERSLEKVKFDGGKLAIFQTEEGGHGFYYKVECDDYPKTSPVSFLYETWDENGVVKERRLKDFIRIQVAPRQHNSPIPEEFFTALSEMQRHYGVHTLTIENMPFETPLMFGKLRSTLIDHRIALLECNYMSCNEKRHSKFDEIRKEFTDLAKRIRKVDLTRSLHVPSFITEDFLRDVVDSRLVEYLEHEDPRNVSVTPRFPLDQSMLPRLLRFITLEASPMIMDVNLVGNFCMMYMDEREENSPDIGCWRFTVDQPLTTQILTQHIDTSRYEYKSSTNTELDMSYSHYIVRKAGEMTACICFRGTGATVANANVVTVEFMHKWEIDDMESDEEYDHEMMNEYDDDDMEQTE